MDGRTDAGVTGILLAHPEGSGELKKLGKTRNAGKPVKVK